MNFHSAIRRRGETLLDLTPLIDVVFLLLIFFLITTTFVRQQDMVVTINLPEGAAQPLDAEQEELTVLIDNRGGFTLSTGTEGGLTLDYDALETELRTRYETNPELGIFLRGDRTVNYGAVIDILLMARRIGFQRVQAVIRSPRGAPE